MAFNGALGLPANACSEEDDHSTPQSSLIVTARRRLNMPSPAKGLGLEQILSALSAGWLPCWLPPQSNLQPSLHPLKKPASQPRCRQPHPGLAAASPAQPAATPEGAPACKGAPSLKVLGCSWGGGALAHSRWLRWSIGAS